MSDIQIGQLPQTNSVVDTMQFPVETANVTQKIYATSLKNYVSNLPSLTAAGNITGANLVTATTGNVYTGNVIARSLIYGTLSTATQSAITRVGTLSNLSVSGNISATNVSGNATGTNAIFSSIFGTLQTPAQPLITAVGTLTSLQAGSSGNVVIVSSTPSTSTTTGALVVAGGAGIGGDVYIGGNASVVTNLDVAGVLTASTPDITASNTQVATTAFVDTRLSTKADIDSQVFTGTPSLPTGTTAVTQITADSSTKLATTAFVQAAISSGLNNVDLSVYAPKFSPVFTGTPVLPTSSIAVTQNAGDNSNKLATTAFVYEANVGLANNINYQLSLKAPVNNPTFTGTVSGVSKSAVGLSNVDNTSDANKPISLAQQSALDLKADLASPIFTGFPILPTGTTAVTQTTGDSSTKLATTEFVATAARSATPTGALMMWPTATAPTGYLLCNGAAVSRTTYAVLFSVIGTTFGQGDGSSTFNLPNYTNRMPIGAGTTAALAATGGSKDAVLVSHTHTATVTDPGHTHTYDVASGKLPQSGSSTQCFVNTAGSNTGSAKTGITVLNGTEGEAGTNKNLPPYLGINFIIKT